MVRWVEKPLDEARVRELAEFGCSPLMARLLALRGVDKNSYRDYFHPDYRKLSAPAQLPGIVRAAGLILDEIERGGRIVVFGDYDCDGFCATAILTRTILKLGGNAYPFIPRRIGEGYGMTATSLQRLLSESGPIALVVTVDNGINSENEIASLRRSGIPVIVTDHHLPGEKLPVSSEVFVDPKVPETNTPAKLQTLCGAGIAYCLAGQLVAEARRRRNDEQLAKGLGGKLFTLAGLATVTDIMPLYGDNRILVAESLRNFHRWAPVGLIELYYRSARSASTTLTARDFGFMLGPRINACGRLGDGSEALALLLSDDREEARTLALKVDGYNIARKKIEQDMTVAALAKIVDGASAQVIDLGCSSETVHVGVAGIVAARVLEKLSENETSAGVPVCVLVDGNGSCRAPAGYNLRAALDECADLLAHYGGHALAAGLGVKPGMTEAFRERFVRAIYEQNERIGEDELSTVAIDAWVDPGAITLELAETIALMEPFGEGNGEPIFALRSVSIENLRALGSQGNHLQLTVSAERPLRGVWWNHGQMAAELRDYRARRFDIMFTLEISSFGERHVELKIISMRPSTAIS